MSDATAFIVGAMPIAMAGRLQVFVLQLLSGFVPGNGSSGSEMTNQDLSSTRAALLQVSATGEPILTRLLSDVCLPSFDFAILIPRFPLAREGMELILKI